MKNTEKILGGVFVATFMLAFLLFAYRAGSYYSSSKNSPYLVVQYDRFENYKVVQCWEFFGEVSTSSSEADVTTVVLRKYNSTTGFTLVGYTLSIYKFEGTQEATREKIKQDAGITGNMYCRNLPD